MFSGASRWNKLTIYAAFVGMAYRVLIEDYTLKTYSHQKITWAQFLVPFLLSTCALSSRIAVSPGRERNSERQADDVGSGDRQLKNSGFWISCSMDNSFRNLNSKAFCSRQLRHHHAFRNFFLARGSQQLPRKIHLWKAKMALKTELMLFFDGSMALKGRQDSNCHHL